VGGSRSASLSEWVPTLFGHAGHEMIEAQIEASWGTRRRTVTSTLANGREVTVTEITKGQWPDWPGDDPARPALAVNAEMMNNLRVKMSRYP